MLSILSSLLNSQIGEGGDQKGNTVKGTIKKVLNDKVISYNETNSGINLNINNKYNIIIPYNVLNVKHVQIKKLLKDKEAKCIECTYLYKIREGRLEFITRVKILDSNNIRSDDDDSRIDKNVLKIVEELLEEIKKEYKGSESVESTEKSEESITNTDVLDYKKIKDKSRIKKLYNTTLTEND